jgi:hypothetical protein
VFLLARTSLLLALTGCTCVGRLDVQARSRELLRQSYARADAVMRTTAAQHGATLLPTKPERFTIPVKCLGSVPQEDWVAAGCDPPWLNGKKLVLPIREEDAPYARLASKGDDLLLLLPRIVHRKVDSGTACHCESGYMVTPPTFAFVLDTQGREPSVTTLRVRVTEDFIAWTCASTEI